MNPQASVIADFRPTREVELPHLRAVAREFEHLPTGARLLHLVTQDPENCFALAFATPPANDTGVPHILEHAVLAGSEKFPVREPFFELIKSSPAGFINAMTSDVWTIYPICTTLEGDFFNLAEVYADAVFHPLLTRDTFEREGHHLELETPGDLSSPLVRSGIVYNEMKGAYSDTGNVLGWRLKSRLFRGGALGYDSGGDPAAIPDLTWEGLRDFYARFYAAGNCLLFLYGDIPTEKHLEFWGEKLKTLEKRPSLAARPASPQWSEPQRLETTYAAEPGAPLTQQTYLSLRWKCGDGLDRADETAWRVLSFLLAGHDGAPLKKALVDSHLGADVFACSVEDVESELAFHVAIKGSERERADEFESFVLGALEQIALQGFSEAEVATAFRQVSYETLEVASLFPLHLAFEIGRYASCGADPLDATRSKEMLDALREKVAVDGSFWVKLIRQRLVENPHRLRVVLYPDPQHAAREDEREKSQLAALKAALTETELQQIDERAQQLEAAQNEPNSPEALATLPTLVKADLPDAPREIPTSVANVAGFTVLRNDVFSNGVVYLQAAVDVRDLPASLWKFLPRWTDALEKMGVTVAGTSQSWETVAARRAALTGGLGASQVAVLNAQTGQPLVDVRLSLKTLDNDVEGAFALLGDLVFGLDASDQARLLDVQNQHIAGLRETLVNNAISAAMVSAARGKTPVGWLNYLWNSPLTLAWNKHLCADFGARAGELIEGIQAVGEFLHQKSRWTWSFTGSDAAFEGFARGLESWSQQMRDGALHDAVPAGGTTRFDGALELSQHLGLAAPIDVQFCVRAFSAPERQVRPLIDLGLSLAGFDYFLPEIRLKGNAYGAGVRLNGDAGLVTMYSYRDPRLSETLRVFDGFPAWLDAQNWSDADLERALLGNVSDAVPAIRPEQSTGRALHRHRIGETAAMRAEQYRAKLNATPQAVKAATQEYLQAVEGQGATAVAASRAALEEANRQLGANGEAALEIVEMVE